MVANMEKLKQCFRALISCLGTFLTLKFPLWLYIVACLVCALLFGVIACSANHNLVNSAVVGATDYRGHNYLVFSADGNFSVVHDPDCICVTIKSEL